MLVHLSIDELIWSKGACRRYQQNDKKLFVDHYSDEDVKPNYSKNNQHNQQSTTDATLCAYF